MDNSFVRGRMEWDIVKESKRKGGRYGHPETVFRAQHVIPRGV